MTFFWILICVQASSCSLFACRENASILHFLGRLRPPFSFSFGEFFQPRKELNLWGWRGLIFLYSRKDRPKVHRNLNRTDAAPSAIGRSNWITKTRRHWERSGQRDKIENVVFFIYWQMVWDDKNEHVDWGSTFFIFLQFWHFLSFTHFWILMFLFHFLLKADRVEKGEKRISQEWCEQIKIRILSSLLFFFFVLSMRLINWTRRRNGIWDWDF